MNVAEWRRRGGVNPDAAEGAPYRWLAHRHGDVIATGPHWHGRDARHVAEIRLADLMADPDSKPTDAAGIVVWAWPSGRPSQRVEVRADDWIAHRFSIGA